MNTIKALIAGLMLLAVFSLPTLTATQLVTVLGEKTTAKPIVVTLETSAGAYRTLQGGILTVSYLKPGLFPLVRVTNPNPVSRVVRVSLAEATDPKIASAELILSAANASDWLYEHSLKPTNPSYDIVIPAGVTRRLDLLVKGDPDVSGTVKMKLAEY